MHSEATYRKPGNVQHVNDFILRSKTHKHLWPLVHCDGLSCSTLLSARKEKYLCISAKSGDSTHKRLCKSCKEERIKRGDTVL